MPDVRIEFVDPETLVSLRHAVLRQNLPLESARFDGDRSPGAVHVAAYVQGKVICCASFIPKAFENEPAVQLRGMATDPAFRTQGIGGQVLSAGEERVKTSGQRLLWCNARTGAIPFYERHGWVVVSEQFDIPTAGPHKVMKKRL